MADNHDVGMLSYQLSTTDKTASVVGFTSSLTEGTALEVPQTIDVDGTTYTVTALADNCLNVTDNCCPLLASVTLPSTVKAIGKAVFRGQSKLTSVSFPDVDEIHSCAFDGCTSLKEATLGNTITVLDMKDKSGYALGVFSADNVLEKLTMTRAKWDKDDNGNVGFNPNLVGKFTKLKELHLPEFTHLNGNGVFTYLSSLVTFDAPKLDNVMSNSFAGCTSLKQLVLPSVITLSQGAFNGCPALTYLECPSCTTVAVNFGGSAGNNIETLKFQSLENVPDQAFQNYYKVTTLEMPKVKTVGNNNFLNFRSLVTLDMPEVETVGENSFTDCSSLESVSMPKATKLGGVDFNGCTKLNSVSLPNLKEMVGTAFQGCTSLTELHLPQLTTLTGSGFSAPALKVLDCPELATLTNVNSLFKNESNPKSTLEEVNMPKLEEPGTGAFSGFVNLEKVNIDGAKTTYATFYGCTSLKSLSLPNVTSIGGYTFNGCTSLESLDLPKVTTIGQNDFTGCTALKYLHFGPNISDISNLSISDTQLDHNLHIYLDYKDKVVTVPTGMDAQKDVAIYHVDYSLLKDYMNTDTWKDYIFERTLDDASEIQFTNGRYYFSLKRALKPAEWSTLVLPFSLTAEQVKATFGTGVKLAEYTGSEKSPKSDDGYILNFKKTETITAGVPVLICGADEKADNTYLASTLELGGSDSRGTAVERGISQTDPSADSNNHFNLQGTYTHNASFIQAGDYYLGNGNTLRHAKSAKALGSARMVIRYAGTNPQAKLTSMSFDGETTGIDEIRLDADTRAAIEGFNAAHAPAYSLTGQRVGDGYKGIVIVNGKKILRK